MKIDKIKEEILKQTKEIILSVIEGESLVPVKLFFVKPSVVIEIFSDLYGEKINFELDNNGWQWNFCITFEYKGGEYEISGDGFNQDSMTLKKLK